MRLGKYLSELTKSELDDIKIECALTDSEKLVLDMVQNQKSEIQIADKLCMSVPTVARRKKAIADKMERRKGLKQIPIWEKMNLTIDEAAEYSNIGINKISELANDPLCPFVLYVGRKRLIKRVAFEKFIASQVEI